MQTLTYRSEIAKINAALTFNPALTCLALADDVEAMVSARHVEDGLEALFDGLLGARENMSREDWQALARYLRSEHPSSMPSSRIPSPNGRWRSPAAMPATP